MQCDEEIGGNLGPMSDITAFFEDLRITDDSCFANDIDGEATTIGNTNEFLSDVIQTKYPPDASRMSKKSMQFDCNTESEEEIEVPRGYSAASVSTIQEKNDGVPPHEKAQDDHERVENFLRSSIENPSWVRSLQYVKWYANFPKELQVRLITHTYVNVDKRPKYMKILTEDMNAYDLTQFVKIAFDTDCNPPHRSLFRLYCRNPVHGLKALLRAILLATVEKPFIEVEYMEVLGELSHRGLRIRSKTDDIIAFFEVEELGRTLGMRFLATLLCRSANHRNRLLQFNYYDELKRNGERVIYLHIDHEAWNNHGIKFSDDCVEIPYEVETKMKSLRCASPRLYDLISLIHKLSSH